MDESRLERFQWFYRSEFATVARTVYLVYRDRALAKRATEAAFARAYRRWTRLGRTDRPELWVRRTALKRAASASRRALFSRRSAGIEAPVAERPQAHPELWAALGELSRAQRVATVLFYFEDRPASDIAEIEGSSEAAVKSHLQRALRRLGPRLGEEVSDVTR